MRTTNNVHSSVLPQLLSLAAGLLVLRVTVGVVLNYWNYIPPNFESEFLIGRQPYFFGSYQWAFYTHIVSGPVSLILGLVLVSEHFRKTFPKWHRNLGRVQAIVILFALTPSGLWMSYHAASGPVAGLGFAMLAVLTSVFVVMGWRSALRRRFGDHRRWMWRCFLALCSAVVLRLFAGLATVMNLEYTWIYPFSAWASWLLPLAVFELSDWRKRQVLHLGYQSKPALE